MRPRSYNRRDALFRRVRPGTATASKSPTCGHHPGARLTLATRDSFRPHEKSDLQTLYTEADSGGPLTVWTDQWFTRRKRFHAISDERGEALYRSRWFSDILEWLHGAGRERYRIITATGRVFTVTVQIENEKDT